MLDQEVTLDEKNVIMYACGYVPVALINRYEKRKDPKYGSFVQCLLHMSIGEYEDTFCGYARKWLESVNHGGAFEGTFNFFLALEISVRHSLSVHLDLSTDTTRKPSLPRSRLSPGSRPGHDTKGGSGRLFDPQNV